MSIPSSPSGSIPWTHYDKQLLHPVLRRRKLIGRFMVPESKQAETVEAQLKMTYADLASHVAQAFEWLGGGKLGISNPWQLWITQNSSLYLVPIGQDLWHFKRAVRHFDETLSSDAAGLCATELAINRIGYELPMFTAPSVGRLGHRLADYRHMHPEGARVSAVLD